MTRSTNHFFRLSIFPVILTLLLIGGLLTEASAQDLFVSNESNNTVSRVDGVSGANLGVFASGGGLSGTEGLDFGAS